MIKVNGKQSVYRAGTTVEELILQSGYALGRIAVERNGEILPKDRYGQEVVQDGDRFEIVCFVGGG